MDPIQRRANRTRLIVLGLSFFALLVITVLLGVSCNKPDTPQRPVKASPSPTPSGTPTSLPFGDTPIIVKGGGSIDLEYDEAIFTGNPLTCSTCTIKSVTLDQIPDAGQKPSPSPSPCTLPSPIPDITIETKNNKDDITIVSIAGGGVQIKPKAGSTYDDLITECGDEKKHHAVDGEIKKIKVGNDECGGCTGNKKRCRIEILVQH